MPFIGMLAKIRKDPLGPSTMAMLKNNTDVLRRMSGAEHVSVTGEHNAREVPRVVRRISGTTVSPSSTDITAVTNGTTGTYVLTLASGRFDLAAEWIVCQINPCGAGVASKPFLTGYKIISATSIEVYIGTLSSALVALGGSAGGGGNTWAAANVDFDIAIHSEPVSAGAYPTDLPSNSLSGDTLKPTRWNALVLNSADVNMMTVAEHTTAGLHSTRQVATRSGMWRYDGANLSLTIGIAVDLTGVRTSVGVYTMTSSVALESVSHCFCTPDYARLNAGLSDDLLRVNVRQTSTTQFVVYTYVYQRGDESWSRCDCDFWLAIHGGNG